METLVSTYLSHVMSNIRAKAKSTSVNVKDQGDRFLNVEIVNWIEWDADDDEVAVTHVSDLLFVINILFK